jgi:hypothetical protein
LHYAPQYPGEPKWAEVGDDGLAGTLLKLLEVAESINTGGYSVYRASLAQPFAALYERLNREWKPRLEGMREDQFPLFEALDLLFRSVVVALDPEWLALLEKYANDNTLAEEMSRQEEHALRQLRNLGLVQHDGQWLFTPTRSSRLWPTPAGRVFLTLAGQAAESEAESVAREVVQRLKQVVKDQAAVDLLEKVSKGRSLTNEEKDAARPLRNRRLITHATSFLAGAKELKLTDLGYHVLGKCSPD